MHLPGMLHLSPATGKPLDRQVPKTVTTVTTAGVLADTDVVVINSGTGALAFTLSAAQLVNMVDRVVTIINLTADAHTVALTGGNFTYPGLATDADTWTMGAVTNGSASYILTFISPTLVHIGPTVGSTIGSVA